MVCKYEEAEVRDAHLFVAFIPVVAAVDIFLIPMASFVLLMWSKDIEAIHIWSLTLLFGIAAIVLLGFTCGRILRELYIRLALRMFRVRREWPRTTMLVELLFFGGLLFLCKEEMFYIVRMVYQEG